MFEALYGPDEEDLEIFGDHWCFDEATFGEKGNWHLVAKYEATSEEGVGSEIYCAAMPARFYRLKVLDGYRWDGTPRPGVTLSTGSGTEMARLVAKMAEAFAEGMLGAD